MCSITPETANVGSSYNRMRGPGIGCWFSDRSNCSHWSLTLTFYTDQWEDIVIYHSITFTGPYTTILTPTTVVQRVDNHSWGLYCRRCYCIRVCWGLSSQIFHFSRWLGQLSTVLTKDESPHTGYTFIPMGGVFRALGRRDLDFTSHPNDDGEPWERFSESRPNSLAGVVFRNRVLNSGHNQVLAPAGWPLNL